MGDNAARSELCVTILCKLCRGAECRHGAVVYYPYPDAVHAIARHALTDSGELCKFRFIVKCCVFAHTLCLGRLAAENAVVDDDVREAQPYARKQRQLF